MPNFAGRRIAERHYYSYMKKVIAQIDKIVKKYYDPEEAFETARLYQALNLYSDTLEPWAKKAARKLIRDCNSYNLMDWQRVSARLGRQFRESFKAGDPVFETALALQDAEVTLIKSLPLEAATRAQKLSQEYMMNGRRHEELAKMIMESSNVAQSRAKCIARTEMAKANTMLTKSRAESIGVKYFIWRTAEDEIVRETHAELEGKMFSFDDPPYIEGEGAHLPGDIWNCRCYPEPVLETAVL